MKSQRQKQKNAERKKKIQEANLKHDAEHGVDAKSPNYYTRYIQGTGLRQSK